MPEVNVDEIGGKLGEYRPKLPITPVRPWGQRHELFHARCGKFVIGEYDGPAYCVQRLIFAVCKTAEGADGG
jgi:hypothetical protein